MYYARGSNGEVVGELLAGTPKLISYFSETDAYGFVMIHAAIPLPRAWLLTSSLLIGYMTGQLAAVSTSLLVTTPVRPDIVIALVTGVPSMIGLIMITFSQRRWVTAFGAGVMAIAPGWLAALVLVQVVSGG